MRSINCLRQRKVTEYLQKINMKAILQLSFLSLCLIYLNCSKNTTTRGPLSPVILSK